MTEAEQPWIRVPSRRRKKASRREPSHNHTSLPHPHLTLLNLPPKRSPSLTLAEISHTHALLSAQWHATPAPVELGALIASALARRPSQRITRAICLGPGSLDTAADVPLSARRAAHIQVEAFRWLTEAISQSQSQSSGRPYCPGPTPPTFPPDIPCLVQEPAFTDTDVAFIRSLGADVVESPCAFDFIDSNTLVFGVHLYRAIWAAALTRGLPGVYVGTGLDVWEECLIDITDQAELTRLREMHRSSDKFDFPQHDGHHIFSSTCIYWRRCCPDEDDGG